MKIDEQEGVPEWLLRASVCVRPPRPSLFANEDLDGADGWTGEERTEAEVNTVIDRINLLVEEGHVRSTCVFWDGPGVAGYITVFGHSRTLFPPSLYLPPYHALAARYSFSYTRCSSAQALILLSGLHPIPCRRTAPLSLRSAMVTPARHIGAMLKLACSLLIASLRFPLRQRFTNYI